MTAAPDAADADIALVVGIAADEVDLGGIAVAESVVDIDPADTRADIAVAVAELVVAWVVALVVGIAVAMEETGGTAGKVVEAEMAGAEAGAVSACAPERKTGHCS